MIHETIPELDAVIKHSIIKISNTYYLALDLIQYSTSNNEIQKSVFKIQRILNSIDLQEFGFLFVKFEIEHEFAKLLEISKSELNGPINGCLKICRLSFQALIELVFALEHGFIPSKRNK